MKMIEKHFRFVVCGFLVFCLTLFGATVSFVGVAHQNETLTYAGIHLAVWPTILFLIGTAIVEAMSGGY